MTEPQDAEMDALAALGALAEFASEQAKEEPGVSDPNGAAPPPAGPPKAADMQKWIQCSECEKWRKVPFNVSDSEIPDDWTCGDNVWGMDTAVCGEEQAMSNDEIDYILSSQVGNGGHDDDEEHSSRRRRKGAGRQGTNNAAARGGHSRPRVAAAVVNPSALVQHPSNGGGIGTAHNDQDEAAEALLGMLAFEGSDSMHGLEAGKERNARRSSGIRFPPGSIVWAKVEGHDWWPAVAVRRRAVPREVGPPPGGPAVVRSQIPVVFFKPDGIPGLAPSTEPLADAAVRLALRQETTSGDDEAEYAWLPAEALRLFDPGSGPPPNPDRPAGLPVDPGLEDCVAAAETALAADPEGASAIAAASSDSDGGWAASGSGAGIGGPGVVGGGRGGGGRGGRGSRGKKARARGTRRARGRGRGGDDDGFDSDDDYDGNVGGGAGNGSTENGRIVVEAILGWRWGRPDPGSNDPAPEYLVKYGGRSHVHDEWVPEAVLLQVAKRKVLNFRKRAGSAPCVLADPAWTRPERLVARRPSPAGPGWEILVKWEGLGYEAATWESESEQVLAAPAMAALHRDMWRRQEAALERAPGKLAEHDAMACRRLRELISQPEGTRGAGAEQPGLLLHTDDDNHHNDATTITTTTTTTHASDSYRLLRFVDELAGPPLAAHQLSAVDWLLKRWIANVPGAVLGDAPGMGKSVSVLAFLETLRRVGLRRPSLIVVPASALESWDGEYRHWSRPGDPEVLVYAGSFAARGTLLQSELWLRPGALEGRGLPAILHDSHLRRRSYAKPDVVLTTHEVLASDAAELADVPWGAIVFDDRERVRGAAAKAVSLLREMRDRHAKRRTRNIVGEERAVTALTGGAGVEEERSGKNINNNGFDTERTAPFAVVIAGPASAEEPRGVLGLVDPTALAAIEDEEAEREEQEEQEGSGPEEKDDDIAMEHDADEHNKPPPTSPLTKLAEVTLARDHSTIGPCAVPSREVRVRVAPSEAQREAARLVLARAYEALADGRAGRRDGWRAGALRTLLHELRAVAVAPVLVEEEEEEEEGVSREASFGPGTSSGAYNNNATNNNKGETHAMGRRSSAGDTATPSIDTLVSSSGKLAILERLLLVARRTGLRLAVVAHDPRALALVARLAASRFPDGPPALSVDAATTPAVAAAATAAWNMNRGEFQPWLFLLHTRAVGLGTALTALDAVVILDADPAGLSPVAPSTEGTPELSCAARLGNTSTLRVLRLVTRCAAERAPLELAERVPRLACRLAAGQGAKTGGVAALAADARALELVLRAAALEAFGDKRSVGSSNDHGLRAQQGDVVVTAESNNVEQEASITAPVVDDDSDEAPLTDAQLELLLVGGNRRPNVVKGEDGNENALPSNAGNDAGWPPATLQAVLGPTVSVHQTRAMPPPPPINSSAVNSTTSTSLVQSPPFSPPTEEELRVLGQIVGPAAVATLEEQPQGTVAAVPSSGGAGLQQPAVEGSLTPPLPFWATILAPTWQRLQEEGETRREDQRGGQAAGRLGREPSDAYDASDPRGDLLDLDRRFEDVYEDAAAWRRGAGGRAHALARRSLRGGRQERRGGGAGAFRRRVRPDEAAMLLEETGDVFDPEELVHRGSNIKRPRRSSRDAVMHPPPRPLSPETEALRSEWLRHEATMRAIADPTTAEALIARTAVDRVSEMARELGLPGPIIEIAHQAAEILLMMRPHGEAPSDFQEYTLVAILAVAAHLSQHYIGERHGLEVLAQRYGQDVDALEQVFDYIMQSLVTYRAMHVRVQQLAVDGVISLSNNEEYETGGMMGAHHHGDAVPAPPSSSSDLDGFTAKLNAILAADLAPAALAAGPLDVGNNLVQQLGAMLAPESPGGALPAEVEALLHNLRGIQEQVALLDRIQNLRVKNIQDEYQRFMERVRGKAQGAIDTANAAYSQQRTVLMARFDALVNVLSQHQQSSQAAQRQQQQQQQVAAAVAQHQQQAPNGYSLDPEAEAVVGQQFAQDADQIVARPMAATAAGEQPHGTTNSLAPVSQQAASAVPALSGYVAGSSFQQQQPGSATAVAAAMHQQQLAAMANPAALSHAMATQFLSLQAGMAAQAAAAAAAAAGKPPSAAAAAVAAAAAAQHPFGALLAQAGHFSEAELRGQLEQFEMLAKAGQLPPGAEQHIALLQAAIATAHAQAQAAAVAQQQAAIQQLTNNNIGRSVSSGNSGGGQVSNPARGPAQRPRSGSSSPATAERPSADAVGAMSIVADGGQDVAGLSQTDAVGFDPRLGPTTVQQQPPLVTDQTVGSQLVPTAAEPDVDTSIPVSGNQSFLALLGEGLDALGTDEERNVLTTNGDGLLVDALPGQQEPAGDPATLPQ